jgi:pilus assembly protein Flp/PilA
VESVEKLLRFLKDEEGATAIEYGLIAALIAAIIVGALVVLGQNVSSTFSNIATAVSNAISGGK